MEISCSREKPCRYSVPSPVGAGQARAHRKVYRAARVRFEHCSGVLPSFLETHFGPVCGKAPSHTTDPVSYVDPISPFLVSGVLLSFYCWRLAQCQCSFGSEALGSVPRYWKTERQNREYICYFRSFSLVSFQF